MGIRGALLLVLHALVVGLAVFAHDVPPNTPFILPYYLISEEDSKRTFAEMQATLQRQGKQTKVTVQLPLPEGGTHTVSTFVSSQDLEEAKEWVARGRAALRLPNGGRIPAAPKRLVVLNSDGFVSIGLEVIHEDGAARARDTRDYSFIRSVQPLDVLFRRSTIDPSSEALFEQRYLLGSTALDTPAVPILVFGHRTLEDGTPAFLVAERKHFVDPDSRLVPFYWTPVARVRVPETEAEYQALTEKLEDPAFRKAYRRFRQQVLGPWTHRLFYFEDFESNPFLEANTERFSRRAKEALKWLNSQPEWEEDRYALGYPSCPQFLYDLSELQSP